MNSLYNKIYKAINTGIHKALVLPDEIVDDISIRFHHKKISNNFNIMDEYVRDLLNNSDPEHYYNQIMEYHNETYMKYKANDFNELLAIFDKIKNIKHFDIRWINMSDVVTVILEDNIEIPFDQFNPNIHNAKFIKLKNNVTGHDIILHKNLWIKRKCKWLAKVGADDSNGEGYINALKYGSFDKACQMAVLDYDGYMHTYENDNNNCMAFRYCKEDLKSVDYKYEAYLPALGELQFLYDRQQLINYILKKTNGKKLSLDKYYWSSTEYSHNDSWYSYDGTAGYLHKTYMIMILPLFIKKS